jgi:LemA protein
MSLVQVGLLALAVLLASWMVGAYNRLVALRNGIVTAWRGLDEGLQRRAQAVAALVAVLRAPLAGEQGALDTLLAAQAQVSAAALALGARPLQAELAAALLAAETSLQAAASRVMALQEQLPGLQNEAAVAAPLAAWRECAPQLLFLRQTYNKACADYDEAVHLLPTRWLARLYGFHPAGRL